MADKDPFDSLRFERSIDRLRKYDQEQTEEETLNIWSKGHSRRSFQRMLEGSVRNRIMEDADGWMGVNIHPVIGEEADGLMNKDSDDDDQPDKTVRLQVRKSIVASEVRSRWFEATLVTLIVVSLILIITVISVDRAGDKNLRINNSTNTGFTSDDAMSGFYNDDLLDDDTPDLPWGPGFPTDDIEGDDFVSTGTKVPDETNPPPPQNNYLYCIDEPIWEDGNQFKDCSWHSDILTKQQRCASKPYRENCRATCSPGCNSIAAKNEKSDVSCVDDPSFRYKGHSQEDCEWASRLDTEKRCSHEEVFLGCPATCDPECQEKGDDEDSNGDSGGDTLDGTEFPTENPTSLPTAMPTILDEFDEDDDDPEDASFDDVDDYVLCQDDPKWYREGTNSIFEDCNWAAEKNTIERCDHEGMMENCPATCDPDCKEG